MFGADWTRFMHPNADWRRPSEQGYLARLISVLYLGRRAARCASLRMTTVDLTEILQQSKGESAPPPWAVKMDLVQRKGYRPPVQLVTRK